MLREVRAHGAEPGRLARTKTCDAHRLPSFATLVPIDSLYVSRYSVIQNVYTKKQTDGIATRHFRFTNSQGARAWRVARAGNRASNRADYKRRIRIENSITFTGCSCNGSRAVAGLYV